MQSSAPARKAALVIGVNRSPASVQPELRCAEESAARLAELHGGGPLLGEQLKRRAEARQQPPPQIVVVVEGAQAALPAAPISDPTLPQRVTPRSHPSVRVELAPAEERKRR